VEEEEVAEVETEEGWRTETALTRRKIKEVGRRGSTAREGGCGCEGGGKRREVSASVEEGGGKDKAQVRGRKREGGGGTYPLPN